MLTITKEFVFNAAHRLYRNDLSPEKNLETYGQCCKLHGHTYRLQVAVTGDVGENGMILDFGLLKRIVNDVIISRYEHVFLNDLEEYRDVPPTVENMLVHIFRVLEKRLNEINILVVSATLYETPTSWATINKDA